MKNHRKYILLILILSITIAILKNIEFDFSAARASHISNIPTVAQFSGSLNQTRNSRKISPAKLPASSFLSEEKIDTADSIKKDLLCKFKSVRTNVPLDGDVQIFISPMIPSSEGNANNVAWVKSNTCPEGTYSIVHFSDDGRVLQEMDCRSSTLTEIAVMSGEQADVNDVPARADEVNLAISGPGYFLLRCPSGNLTLTRDGKFQKATPSGLMNKDGCHLLNQDGDPFQGPNVNPSGCHSNGECVATVDPSFDDVEGLEYLNNYSFQAKGVGQMRESVTKIGTKILRPSFFTNALEDIHNSERGLTSVSWSNHPKINLNSIECP